VVTILWGSNFWLSHKKEKSPLTHGLNYRSACDRQYYLAILFYQSTAVRYCRAYSAKNNLRGVTNGRLASFHQHAKNYYWILHVLHGRPRIAQGVWTPQLVATLLREAFYIF